MQPLAIARKIGAAAATLLLTFCMTSAFAQKCRVVEYAELKDMSTDELLRLGDSFVSNLELRQISLDYDLKASGLSSDPTHAIRAQQKAQDLEQCKSEADRIASLVKKRKDLKRAVAAAFLADAFIKRYNLK